MALGTTSPNSAKIGGIVGALSLDEMTKAYSDAMITSGTVSYVPPAPTAPWFEQFYSPNNATPTELPKPKPRITRTQTFYQSGGYNNWLSLDSSISFENWQKSNPQALITSTTPVWNQQYGRLDLIVVYSQEL
jgi:hypothetical protein